MLSVFRTSGTWGRVLAMALVVALAGCGGSNSAPNAASTTPTGSVSITPASATLSVGGESLSFTASTTGPAAGGVTWQVNGIEGGNTSVGTISASGLYVSPSVMPQPANVTIRAVAAADPSQSATAAVQLTASMPVSVTVTPTPVTVRTGATQTFTATVTNASDTTVSWQVNGVAGGNATVGTISAAGLYTAPATPPATPTVTVTAVSAQDATKSGSASVTVSAAASVPPSISGTPATTVTAGQTYSFTPTASGSAGASLTFSIANKPTWASFSTTTGQLTGTPASTDVGATMNVTISVSDSAGSASLAPFTITVQSGVAASVTLSWTAPTSRTDGTALTNLAGYRIHYGTSPGNYPTMIAVPTSTLTYTVPNLSSGTYYFVLTAYDSGGVESGDTNPVSTTIP